MTEDAAIRINFDSASLCTLPTLWSSSSIQHPDTCPTGSLELAPQEWTRTSPTRPILLSVPLTASPTCFASHALGSPVSSRHCPSHGPKTCPSQGRPKTYWLS